MAGSKKQVKQTKQPKGNKIGQGFLLLEKILENIIIFSNIFSFLCCEILKYLVY